MKGARLASRRAAAVGYKDPAEAGKYKSLSTQLQLGAAALLHVRCKGQKQVHETLRSKQGAEALRIALSMEATAFFIQPHLQSFVLATWFGPMLNRISTDHHLRSPIGRLLTHASILALVLPQLLLLPIIAIYPPFEKTARRLSTLRSQPGSGGSDGGSGSGGGGGSSGGGGGSGGGTSNGGTAASVDDDPEALAWYVLDAPVVQFVLSVLSEVLIAVLFTTTPAAALLPPLPTPPSPPLPQRSSAGAAVSAGGVSVTWMWGDAIFPFPSGTLDADPRALLSFVWIVSELFWEFREACKYAWSTGGLTSYFSERFNRLTLPALLLALAALVAARAGVAEATLLRALSVLLLWLRLMRAFLISTKSGPLVLTFFKMFGMILDFLVLLSCTILAFAGCVLVLYEPPAAAAGALAASDGAGGDNPASGVDAVKGMAEAMARRSAQWPWPDESIDGHELALADEEAWCRSYFSSFPYSLAFLLEHAVSKRAFFACARAASSPLTATAGWLVAMLFYATTSLLLGSMLISMMTKSFDRVADEASANYLLLFAELTHSIAEQPPVTPPLHLLSLPYELGRLLLLPAFKACPRLGGLKRHALTDGDARSSGGDRASVASPSPSASFSPSASGGGGGGGGGAGGGGSGEPLRRRQAVALPTGERATHSMTQGAMIREYIVSHQQELAISAEQWRSLTAKQAAQSQRRLAERLQGQHEAIEQLRERQESMQRQLAEHVDRQGEEMRAMLAAIVRRIDAITPQQHQQHPQPTQHPQQPQQQQHQQPQQPQQPQHPPPQPSSETFKQKLQVETEAHRHPPPTRQATPPPPPLSPPTQLPPPLPAPQPPLPSKAEPHLSPPMAPPAASLPSPTFRPRLPSPSATAAVGAMQSAPTAVVSAPEDSSPTGLNLTRAEAPHGPTPNMRAVVTTGQLHSGSHQHQRVRDRLAQRLSTTANASTPALRPRAYFSDGTPAPDPPPGWPPGLEPPGAGGSDIRQHM